MKWIIIILIVFAVSYYVYSKFFKKQSNSDFIKQCLDPQYQNNPTTCQQAYDIAQSKGINNWQDWVSYWQQHPNG